MSTTKQLLRNLIEEAKFELFGTSGYKVDRFRDLRAERERSHPVFDELKSVELQKVYAVKDRHSMRPLSQVWKEIEMMWQSYGFTIQANRANSEWREAEKKERSVLKKKSHEEKEKRKEKREQPFEHRKKDSMGFVDYFDMAPEAASGEWRNPAHSDHFQFPNRGEKGRPTKKVKGRFYPVVSLNEHERDTLSTYETTLPEWKIEEVKTLKNIGMTNAMMERYLLDKYPVPDGKRSNGFKSSTISSALAFLSHCEETPSPGT